MGKSVLLLIFTVVGNEAFMPQTSFVVRPTARKIESKVTSSTSCQATISTSGMWNAGMSYGKGPFRFYENFEEWIKPFPEEDQKDFPEIFNIPKGVYEISLRKPLGIVFEEIEVGKGVYVTDLVEGGNADNEKDADGQSIIQPGDILIGITAIKVIGAKWERRMIPAVNFDFDTVVGAIGSNEAKWGCDDVVLQFKRPSEANDEDVNSFLEFFEPPGDSVWRL